VTALRIDVAYVDGAKGPVFLLVRRPVGKPVSTILVIPPFAEEMNKVRASITWLSNLLIENGFAVLVPDFYGTGDSAGDFEDACVETWIGDLQAVMGWSLATIAALELPEGHRIDTGCGSRGFTVGCPLYEQ